MPPKPRTLSLTRRLLLSSAAVAALVLGADGCVALAPGPRDRVQVTPVDDPAEVLGAVVEAHNRERAARGLPALAAGSAPPRRGRPRARFGTRAGLERT